MTTHVTAKDLAQQFEALDAVYPADVLINAHAIAILLQLAKAKPRDRARLAERYLDDLSQWSKWSAEIGDTLKQGDIYA